MNEAIKRAIEDYNKAAKAHTAAAKKARELDEVERKAWNAIKGTGSSFFKRCEEQPELYAEAHKASDAATKARKAADIKKAVLMAASNNAAYIAADALRTAIKATPEKFSAPTHYKKFSEAIAEIVGDDFYLETRYCIHIHFRPGSYGHDTAFVCELDRNGQKIDLSSLEKHEPGRQFPTLKEIEAEAKKAARDAEKIRKIYKEAEAKSEAIKNSYRSNIKYYIPHIFGGLKDDYRLF